MHRFILLPVSQLVPIKPAAQVHVYWFTKLLHVPPFRHGLLLHSFMSVERDLGIIIFQGKSSIFKALIY